MDNSTVSWVGDFTQFSNNSAGPGWHADGGAIVLSGSGSSLSWVGDSTSFSSNFAGGEGGAVFALDSTVSWVGNGTAFSNNSAEKDGGAVYAWDSAVSWVGSNTEFSENVAGFDGGAIFASEATLTLSPRTTLGEATIFYSNVAGGNGGALALSAGTVASEPFDGLRFIGNSAGLGGAIYSLNNERGISFENVWFESNTASDAGGAVAAYVSGGAVYSSDFSRCEFWNNKANGTGGAVETLLGNHNFYDCTFVGNSAGEKSQTVYPENSALAVHVYISIECTWHPKAKTLIPVPTWCCRGLDVFYYSVR